MTGGVGFTFPSDFTMKAFPLFRWFCILTGLSAAVFAQDAQKIIDDVAKTYAEATSYRGRVDSRTLVFVFLPTAPGMPPRYSTQAPQYRSLDLRVNRPYGYYLGLQTFSANPGGMSGMPGSPVMPGDPRAASRWAVLARTDNRLPKQGLWIGGRFTVQDMPAEQFNAMANSRLGARADRDLVLRHFQTLPKPATGNIPLDLLEPEIIGRETGSNPSVRIVAKTVDGYPVTLWVDSKTNLILRSVTQRPARSPAQPGIDTGMPGRPSQVIVEENFYREQRVNEPMTDRDFTITQPDGASRTTEQMGFCGVDELVKLADIAPLKPSESGDVAATDTSQPEAPAETAPPASAAPAPSAGSQALSQTQMEGIVLIEGSDSTASGFMTKIRDVDFIVTNLHVLGGGKNLKFKTLRGDEVPALGYFGAVGSDIAIIRIGQGKGDLTLAKDVLATSKIGDKVVVVGNRLGGGVATQTSGSVLGVGPNRIEVNANFEPGNSGSPIVNLTTGEVVGVATYSETRQVDVESAATNGAAGAGSGTYEKRWFGYRLDSVTKWESIDLATWKAQVERIEKFRELSLALHDLIRFNFKQSRANTRLNPIIDQFQARYQAAVTNQVAAAIEVKDFFRVIRTIADDGVRDLENGQYYDYFRSCLYWESSIPSQLEYRKALIGVLKRYESNSNLFLSRMRNGG